MGKSTMLEIIMEEVKDTCELLQQKAMKNNGKVSMTRGFSPATNNVMWRIVSGRQTRQDDQELVDIMETCQDIFMFFETDSPLKVLQLNSFWFSKMCRWAGVKKNVFDVSGQLRKRLWKEAEEGVPDPNGSFIDRYHYMREQHKNDRKSIFSKKTGMDNLKGSIWDLFLAGKDIIQ